MVLICVVLTEVMMAETAVISSPYFLPSYILDRGLREALCFT